MEYPNETRFGDLLIVDRNADERARIERSLPANTWRTIHAETPTEAAKLCRAMKFEIILFEADPQATDSVTSISSIRHGKGLCNNATIIAISRFIPGAFNLLVTQVGADLHIKRPLPVEEIMVIIKDASTKRMQAHHALRNTSIALH